MTSTYVQISKREFESFLEPYLFALEDENPQGEYVYTLSWGNKDEWFLKIYSSITPRALYSRKKGEDAIRIVLLVASSSTNGNYFPVWKSPHVKRIATWRDNLGRRIEEALYRGMDGADPRYCPTCGNPLVIRDNRENKQFVGCTAWNPINGCKFTMNVKENPR